jgi:asparagine synthase (glutamine-hydrolysing)
MREGLFGIVRPEAGEPVSHDELLAIGTFLDSPQELVTFTDGNLGLAYKRYSHSKYQETKRVGHNNDKSIFGVFNGEIHNFNDLLIGLKENGHHLEKNDLDLITHLYEEYGESFAKRINGLFSFIIWDKKEKKIIAGNDRFGGSRPVYYSQTPKGLFISSQIRGILRLVGEKSLLTDSISRRLEGYSEVGFLLSGGLDSTAIVAISSRILDRSIPTFTVAFEGHSMDESPHAEALSRKYGTNHYRINLEPSSIYELPRLIWELEEPFLDDGLMLGHIVYREAAKHAQVILVGDGSDQIFGTEDRSMAIRSLVDKIFFAGLMKKGFLKATDNRFFLNGKKLEQIKDKFDKAFDFNRWFAAGFANNELRDLLLHNDLRECDPGEDLIDRAFTSFEEAFSFAALRYAIKIQLNEVILKKSAFTAGVNHVTIRAPFLDTDLVDFVQSLAVNLRNRGTIKEHILGRSQSKYVHRMAMKELLPSILIDKSRQGGFVPLSIFLQDSGVKSNIFHIIRMSEVLPNFFSRDYIETVLQSYEETSRKSGYWFYYHQSLVAKVLHLLAFEIWCRQYLEGHLSVQPSFDLRDYLHTITPL